MSPDIKAKDMISKYGKTDAIVQATQCLYLSPDQTYWNAVLYFVTHQKT